MSGNLFSGVKSSIQHRKIIKHVRKRQSSVITIEPNCDGYIIVPDDTLIKCGHKECSNYDTFNDNIYNKKMTAYIKIKNTLEKNSLELKELPIKPPKPNNFERLLKYEQQNKNTNCLIQSNAILYLIKNGYTLVKDICSIVEINHPRKYFEAHHAIPFANELSTIKQENYMNTINYTGNYDFITHDNTHDNTHNNIHVNSNSYNIPQYNIQYEINRHNTLTCNKPEHHNINDKIAFYDLSSNI